MKKLIALLLAIVTLFSLAACQQEGKPEETEAEVEAEQNDDDTDAAGADDTTAVPDAETDEDVSSFTDLEIERRIEENVTEYLMAKYNSTSFMIDEEYAYPAGDNVYRVPVRNPNSGTGAEYTVITNIAKTGEANINFCTDNLQSHNIRTMLNSFYHDLMGENSTRVTYDWLVTTDSEMFFGIDLNANADRMEFLDLLTEKGYKLYARAVYRYNSIDDLYNAKFTDEQKAFFNAFEKLEFVTISDDYWSSSAEKLENMSADIETGFAPYVEELKSAYGYDKTAETFVKLK